MNLTMIPQREPFILTEGEKLNPIWLKLTDYFEHRIQTLRIQNDGVKNENDTAMLRGRIAELKTFIAFNGIQPGLDNLKD